MSVNVKVYLNDLPPADGKLIATERGSSLLFSTEAGRYYITVSRNKEVKISLSSESGCGYELFLAPYKLTGLSVTANGARSYPLDVRARAVQAEFSPSRLFVKADYDVENGDEEVESHSFELTAVEAKRL